MSAIHHVNKLKVEEFRAGCVSQTVSRLVDQLDLPPFSLPVSFSLSQPSPSGKQLVFLFF